MKATLIVIGSIVLLILLSWAGLAYRTATSGIVGKANAHIKKNNYTNIIAKREIFEDMNQEVVSASQRVQLYKTSKDITTKTGVTSYCMTVVAQYNSESRKYTSREFKAIDLPPSYDATITCK